MPRQRELELLFLTIFAAIPLYLTEVIGPMPLIAFHAALIAIAVRVSLGKGPELLPALLMRILGAAYIAFYVVDIVAISGSAIAASTHLVLFIAAYQPMESVRTNNHAQRLLTACLIFVASIATATHIAIVPFVVMFAFLMLRQLMRLSHDESVRAVAQPVSGEEPINRAAGFYLAGTTVIGMMLFPLLPRVHNPLVPGMAGQVTGASTGLSDSIDLNDQRSISSDATVVSRVWMSREAIPFFTPLRLRGTIYDRFRNNEWRQSRHLWGAMDGSTGTAHIARPASFTRAATIQQRLILGPRLLLPTGTYAVSGVGTVVEAPTRDAFSILTQSQRRDIVTYDVRLAHQILPLTPRTVELTNYPVTPAVAQLARQIVGSETDGMKQAALIEAHMARTFRYLGDPSQIGHRMTVDDFLLKERRGHCEYFAAGMVALLTSLNVPARIVGGFYGGKLNPLTGYFIVRREDAHAWVEAWDGQAWRTFDPTPPSLRPGNAQQGLLRAYASAFGDSVNYFWDRYILTFGLADQIALAIAAIERGRDVLSAMRRGAAVGVHEVLSPPFLTLLAAVILGGAIAIWFLRRRRPLFDLLARHLARLGIEVGPAMTMTEALVELRAWHPEAARQLEPLIAMYEAERFSPSPDGKRRALVRRQLAELR